MARKPKQFKVPHCNHCTNYHEFTGNCILILQGCMRNGSKGAAKARGSRSCRSFNPLPKFKENYKEMLLIWKNFMA